MTITALPTYPSRDDPDNFDARVVAYLAALDTWTTEANALGVQIDADAATAAAAALTAVNAPGTWATSTTDITFGVGSKGFGIQTGKVLVPGMHVTIAETAAPGNFMHGPIDSYNSGTGALVVSVNKVRSLNTSASAWTISLSPPMDFVAATAAEIWAATSDDVAVTPAGLLAAGVSQGVADAATIALDLAAGESFHLTTAMAANRTIATPTSVATKVGKWFQFKLPPGGFVPSFSTWWDFGALTPSFSTDPTKADILTVYVRSATKGETRVSKGFGI